MSFDIYGDYLSPGHCEVHPYIHEQYPCSVCYQEQKSKRDLDRAYEKHLEEELCMYYEKLAKFQFENFLGDGI